APRRLRVRGAAGSPLLRYWRSHGRPHQASGGAATGAPRAICLLGSPRSSHSGQGRDRMRRLFTVAFLATTFLLIVGASAASAASTAPRTDGTLTTLPQPRPAWLTDALEAKIVAAGPSGVEVPLGK